jgi:glucose-6-phosphate isomerase
MSDVLDWTSAATAKLSLARHAARADELAKRLAGEVAAGRLPFLSMPFWDKLKGELAALTPWLSGFEHMVLLGIGGSALGARALQKAFFPAQDQPGHAGPWLWILDNVDAYGIEACLTNLPPEKTVVVTVSKSGDTIETLSEYFLVRQWLTEKLPKTWQQHLLLATDEAKGYLREEARQHGARTLPVPDNLGGRYSVLSAVGLVPALFLGLNTDELVAGATEIAAPLCAPKLSGGDLARHPSFELAAWGTALMDAGFCELIFFSYIPLWASFGDWFAQLWAESLGKQGKGSQPLPAVGVTDQHSVNQMYLDGPRNKACLFLTCAGLPDGPAFPTGLPAIFSYLEGKRFGELLSAEALGTRMALAASGVPLIEIRLARDAERAAGKLIALLGAATILAGWLLDINPLDQPAVESGKRLAKARLGAEGLAAEKAELAAFLGSARDERTF